MEAQRQWRPNYWKTTANISEVIETKFEFFLNKIVNIAKERQDTTKHVTEAVEDTNVQTEKRTSYLEEALALLQEHLVDQEDWARGKISGKSACQNIQLIGLTLTSWLWGFTTLATGLECWWQTDGQRVSILNAMGLSSSKTIPTALWENAELLMRPGKSFNPSGYGVMAWIILWLKITMNNTTISFDKPDEALAFFNTMKGEDSIPGGWG